jgi:hypothetical protein
MKYTVGLVSNGTMYVQCFMMIGSGIQVILRVLPQKSERM